jgi:hypothetical protein
VACILGGAVAVVLLVFADLWRSQAVQKPAAPAAPTRAAASPARAEPNAKAAQPPTDEAAVAPAAHAIAPLDRERALDKIADAVARQKATQGKDTQWRKRFEEAAGNDAATVAMASQVEQALAALDAGARAHFLVASIECRGNQCEVLAAMNGVVDAPDANGEYGLHAPIDAGDLARRIAELHGMPNDLWFEFDRGSAKDDYGIFWLRFDEPSPAL